MKNIGTDIKHADIFTKEEETQLWESGTLGMGSPRALLFSVFFLNGKNFCFRGGEEHRLLKISQLKRSDRPICYTYIENGSKNRNGTFSQRYVANKIVPIYANQANRERCHVQLLDFYLSKLPQEAFEKDVFYVRPLSRMPTGKDAPWFSSTPIGRNELSKMVQTMCNEANISGKKTNHSLRATGASQLFEANVPEKIIQERTGHRTATALRLYERTTADQHQAISNILGSKDSVSYPSVLQQYNIQANVAVPPPSHPITPFFNMSGCTVNISFHPPNPPLPPLPELTPEELKELFEGF